MKAFWWRPPYKNCPFCFSPAQLSPGAQKVASRKASPRRGWSFCITRLGKGSYYSQLSVTVPGMPDLSQGFDLATSCWELTGQGCWGGREVRWGGGESEGPSTGQRANLLNQTQMSSWKNYLELTYQPHILEIREPRLWKITGLN